MEQSRLSHFVMRYERVYFTLFRKISALITEQLEEHLTIEQHYAIRYLVVYGPCTVSELAEALLVKPSAVTAQMNRLVSRGLVQRIRNEEDRRVVYLSLTEEGLSMYHDCEQKIYKVIKPYLSKLPENELEQFLQTYEKIDELIKEG